MNAAAFILGTIGVVLCAAGPLMRRGRLNPLSDWARYDQRKLNRVELRITLAGVALVVLAALVGAASWI